MALGESKSALEALLERDLTAEGDGALARAQAQRIARAVAAAIEENNYTVEMVIRQKLQVSGLHV
jgi:hypothetical protein